MFVRVRGPLSNPEFRVAGEEGKVLGKVAECLFVRKLCVIPPTIHPDTGQAYRWIGRPLHEVDFMNCRSWRWTMTNGQSAVSIGLIREVFCSEFTPQLFTGVETHISRRFDSSLSSCGTPRTTTSFRRSSPQRCPRATQGTRFAELPGMIASARRKRLRQGTRGPAQEAVDARCAQRAFRAARRGAVS